MPRSFKINKNAANFSSLKQGSPLNSLSPTKSSPASSNGGNSGMVKSTPYLKNLPIQDVFSALSNFLPKTAPTPISLDSEISEPFVIGLFDYKSLFEACSYNSISHVSATGLYSQLQFDWAMLLENPDITNLILKYQSLFQQNPVVAKDKLAGSNISDLISSNLGIFSNNSTLNARQGTRRTVDVINSYNLYQQSLTPADYQPGTSQSNQKPQLTYNNPTKNKVDVIKDSIVSINILEDNNRQIIKNVSDIAKTATSFIDIYDKFESDKFKIESFFLENKGSNSIYDMLIKHFGYSKLDLGRFSRSKLYLQFLSELTAMSMLRFDSHKVSNDDRESLRINNDNLKNAKTIYDVVNSDPFIPLPDNIKVYTHVVVSNVSRQETRDPSINFSQVIVDPITGTQTVIANSVKTVSNTISNIDNYVGKIAKMFQFDSKNQQNKFRQQLDFLLRDYYYYNNIKNDYFLTSLYGPIKDTIVNVKINSDIVSAAATPVDVPIKDTIDSLSQYKATQVRVPKKGVSSPTLTPSPDNTVLAFESSDFVYKDVNGQNAVGIAGSKQYFDSFFQRENFQISNQTLQQFDDNNSTDFHEFLKLIKRDFFKKTPKFIQRSGDAYSNANELIDDLLTRFDTISGMIKNPYSLPVARPGSPGPLAPIFGNSNSNTSANLRFNNWRPLIQVLTSQPSSNFQSNSVDSSNVGYTFDKLVLAASDESLRKKLFKLLIGTCSDILFTKNLYQYAYGDNNSNDMNNYSQKNQTHFGYHFNVFHYSIGKTNGDDVSSNYDFSNWPNDLKVSQIQKMNDIARNILSISDKFLLGDKQGLTNFSNVNRIMIYDLVFDMLCQYCKITQDNKASTTNTKPQTRGGKPLKIPTKIGPVANTINFAEANSTILINSITSKAVNGIRAVQECQNILQSFVLTLNDVFDQKSAIVDDINDDSKDFKKFINLLSSQGLTPFQVSKLLDKHQLLLLISKANDDLRLLNDDGDKKLKILDPSFPSESKRVILDSASKNELFVRPGVTDARRKIMSVGIPNKILDLLRIDGTGYGTRYTRQPINDFFYVVIDRFNVLNLGLLFKPKKILFQFSRNISKNSFGAPLDEQVGLSKLLEQHSFLNEKNYNYVSYRDRAEMLLSKGATPDVSDSDAIALGLNRGDMETLKTNHALSYALEIYIKSINGIGINEYQIDDFFKTDSTVQMVTPQGAFGFLLNLPDSSVPPSFKDLIFSNATNFSDPDKISQKMITPKYFDRVFNFLISDEDFEVDEKLSDPQTLKNFNDNGFLTTRINPDGSESKYLNSRDFAIDQLIVTLESYSPNGTIKVTPEEIAINTTQIKMINGMSSKSFITKI